MQLLTNNNCATSGTSSVKLLDTNIIIYLQKGLLAEDLPTDDYGISVITEMELRSAPSLDEQDRQWLLEFIKDVTVFELTSTVKENAIQIRQNKKVKLPDAIVAATAITHDAELLTNDKGLLNLHNLSAKEVKIAESQTGK